MTGWHSNHKTSSLEKFIPCGNLEEIRNALKINVAVLCLFLQ
jgi:hypothetical protein